MQEDFESIFPRDYPKNTWFSINFFTSIGLAGLTDNLRVYLKKSTHDSDSDSCSDNEGNNKRRKRMLGS
ncbi:hypothetical protein Lser_V15G36335 [Lactuca serriola]